MVCCIASSVVCFYCTDGTLNLIIGYRSYFTILIRIYAQKDMITIWQGKTSLLWRFKFVKF